MISSVAVALIVPDEALTDVVPMPMPVAIPALLIEATAESVVVHCTELVRSLELPSLYLPVAENC